MRQAAKRALNGPLEPRRQETLRHRAPVSTVSADTESWSGTWFLRGRPRPDTGKTSATSAG